MGSSKPSAIFGPAGIEVVGRGRVGQALGEEQGGPVALGEEDVLEVLDPEVLPGQAEPGDDLEDGVADRAFLGQRGPRGGQGEPGGGQDGGLVGVEPPVDRQVGDLELDRRPAARAGWSARSGGRACRFQRWLWKAEK